MPIIHLRVILDFMSSTSAKEPVSLRAHTGDGRCSVRSQQFPGSLSPKTLSAFHQWADLPPRSSVRSSRGLINLFLYFAKVSYSNFIRPIQRVLYSWNDLKCSVTYFPFGTSISKNFVVSYPRSTTQRTAEMKPVNAHCDERSPL